MQHTIQSSRTARPQVKPAKGVHILFSLPNKKTKFWGVITAVNNGYSGQTYCVTRTGNGDSFTIKASQIVRTAEPGEKLTITHGGAASK